jgi:hypothetical protein
MAKKNSALTVKQTKLTFEQLVSAIRQADQYFSSQANRAVNVSLTLRNWIFGYYISEFELGGQDRAVYGEKLLPELAKKLTKLKVSNCNKRQLYRYLRFYKLYPQIVGTLSPQFSKIIGKKSLGPGKVGTVSPQFGVPMDQLISKLSYSQLEQIAEMGDPLKRAFYEIQSIKGNWSVRDLKRQIASLYFERTGLSNGSSPLTRQPKWHEA